jgi:putative Mg2+ transporter-C (MgtC) family protein
VLAEIDWAEVVEHLIQIAIAYCLAMPIAWNREKETRSAGVRTFPLVAVAACGYMLVGIKVLDGADAQSRVLYAIISGMGFIGGGAILKSGATVSGTATAASLWNTGAIGVAVAYHQYEIAIILSVVNYLTLLVGAQIKKAANLGDDHMR